jgi:hypothetical protein
LSTTKPLCGGACSAQQATRPLECGGGDDVVRVEAFGGAITDAPNAVRVLEGMPITTEVGR